MADRKVNSGMTRDSAVGRETRVKVPKQKPRELYAVCVRPDDKLLIPGKIYKLKLSGDRAGVIDEEGEAAVYPMDFFMELSLSISAKNTLAEVVG